MPAFQGRRDDLEHAEGPARAGIRLSVKERGWESHLGPAAGRRIPGCGRGRAAPRP